jgi:O-antigen ligase
MQRPVETRSRSLGLSRALDKFGDSAGLAYPGLVLFVVFVALVCGGGTRQGLWSDALVQIVSLPLLAVAAFRLRALSGPSKRLPLFLIFAVVLVPVLQLIPLPSQIWTILPGRSEVAEAYTAAGMSLPFLPISLEPLTTLRSVLSLLPAVAVFLGVFCLREEAELRWVLLLILSVAIVGAALGLLQLIGGEGSPLRFYNITSLNRGVGFFANQNHQAAFLYGTIAYAATWASLTWASRARRRPSARRVFRLTFSVILLIALVVGLAATLSRFGILLGLVAGLCSIPLVASLATTSASRRRIIMVAAIANAVALLVMFQFGFVGFAERLSQTLSSDLRWPLVSITAKAANDYFPFGSGIGTFAPIYQRYEPLEYLLEAYVNRAHDDWLETWLEGGLASAAVVCVLVACYLYLAYQSWRTANPNLHLVAYARAGSICVALLLIHSLLDYPLRTTALMVMVAISCAFMLRAYLEKAATSVAHSIPLSRLLGWPSHPVDSPGVR